MSLTPKEMEYTLHEKLGGGAFGEVFKATHVPSKATVAVKKCNLKNASRNVLKMLDRECEAMKCLGHPSLVQAYDIYQNEDFSELFISMEFVKKGDMLAYMLRKKKLSERKAFKFFRQLINGVEYMHNSGFCHRDLKLENIFLNKHSEIKIGDFGFACKWSPESYLDDHPGSFHYSSPEIVAGIPYQGPEADVWALGVILYTMICGALPFRGAKEEMANKIVRGTVVLPSSISAESRELLQAIFDPDRNTRATIEEIKGSDWYQGQLAKCVEQTSVVPVVIPSPAPAVRDLSPLKVDASSSGERTQPTQKRIRA